MKTGPTPDPYWDGIARRRRARRIMVALVPLALALALLCLFAAIYP